MWRILLSLAVVLAGACGQRSGGLPDAAVADLALVEADDGDLRETDVEPEPPELVVMTYNVLCSFCNVDYDPWEERLGYFGDIIARHDPDLIGLQELFLAEEVEQFLEVATGYEALWWQDPEQVYFKDYADAVVLYRRERFELVDNGFYWLSETPDEPLSGGWAEANLPRLVAWAHLRQLSDGAQLYFASTHFDNNPPNQEMSAPLFVERTSQWALEMPAIVVGDFNSKPESPAYGLLEAVHEGSGVQLLNTFALAEEWFVDSNQNPVPEYDPAHRIDHIFVAGDLSWSVSSWVVDTWVYGPHKMYPSDHLAIVARIRW